MGKRPDQHHNGPYSLLLPCCSGCPAETGSLQTAPTATQSALRGPVLRSSENPPKIQDVTRLVAGSPRLKAYGESAFPFRHLRNSPKPILAVRCAVVARTTSCDGKRQRVSNLRGCSRPCRGVLESYVSAARRAEDNLTTAMVSYLQPESFRRCSAQSSGRARISVSSVSVDGAEPSRMAPTRSGARPASGSSCLT